MRFIGLDVHRDFCEVAIAEVGVVRLAGRVRSEPAALALFAQSLGSDDQVALEATGNALEIARIIEPHVARVVLANPKAVKGITRAGAKTDKIDARTLAQLLAGGFLPAVWLPDEQTRILRIHAGGLRYHGVAPLISQLVRDGLIRAEAYLQNDVFASAILFAGSEGILPAPEAAHAIHGALLVAKAADEAGEERTISASASGYARGDFTTETREIPSCNRQNIRTTP